MAWIDGLVQGLYGWITQQVQNTYSGVNHDYSSPEDDGEDAKDEWITISEVVCGTPLRETKCMFVPEMNDFYTDQELNTVYHSAEEYRNAVNKYGFVYKSQKFQNADTPQKLFDYAKDWIKNNYHGGITNFTISALDMHVCGINADKYIVGQRVNVEYIDPSIGAETSQCLTVISAEYDLQKPENNNYKIGIPDVTLNKVYGETSKSGGGGGGGGKSKDETDDETDTELDTVGDSQDADERNWLEYWSNLIYKGPKNDPDEEDAGQSYEVGNTEPPGTSNPTGDFVYGLTADIGNFSNLRGKVGNVARMISDYIKSSGGVDCETVSANTGNVTKVNSDDVKNANKIETKDLEATNNVSAAETITGKNASITQKVTADAGEFGTIKIGSTTVSFGTSGSNPTITINGNRYVLALKSN